MPTPIPFADAIVEVPPASLSSQVKMPEPLQPPLPQAAPGWLGQALSLWQRQPQAHEISPDTPLTGH